MPTAELTWESYHRALGKMASHGMARKVQAGGLPGQAPLGYKNVQGRVEIDEELAPFVVKAFKYLSLQNTSLNAVQRQLHAEGMRAKRGGPIALSTLHRVTNNPFYAGLIRYKGELYPGNHEPLIELSLFQRVQRKRGIRNLDGAMAGEAKK